MATCPKCRSHYGDDVKHCTVDGEPLLPDTAVAGFDSDLKEGDLVGEYRIEKKIGEGGFGKVYAAVHPVIGKRAAIKVLNREYSSNVNVVSRFVSEAKAVNQIRHRNIIDVFSFGSLPGGLQYLIMELLEGETLDAYLEKNKCIAPAQALPILRRIAKALDAAHAAGIAHRDLKPENVFLCYDDEGGVYPKLLDFGIAKLMGDESVHHKTRTGAAMGTPLYMSPEQCRGKGVDHRTDLYSFGVMVHEILTGKLPFDGDSMMDLMFKHAQEPPPAMSSVNPDLPPALDQPVLHLMEKDSAMRPASVTAGVDALIEAAQSVGIDVSVKKSSTLSGTGGGNVRGIPSSVGSNAGETLPVGGPGIAATGSSTLQTVETVPAASGSKTWIVAVAALVIGVGVTLALTRSEPSEQPTPAASGATTETPAAKPSAQPEIAAKPTAEPKTEPTSVVSASASAPSPVPPKPVTGQPPAPQPPAPQPPGPQPPSPQPPPPPIPKPPPSDLESPF